MATFDPASLPPSKWAGALAMALLAQLSQEGLQQLVQEGKAEFVKKCVASDALGLKRSHYEQCFSKLARKAKELGIA